MQALAEQGHLPLAKLEEYWLTCKQAENEAKADILAVEEQILNHPDADLKEEGATKLSAIRVTTGYSRSYDQEQLADIAKDFPIDLWPFRTEEKEIKAGADYLQKNEPELWEMIRPALTIKPKKASFAVIPQKKEA